MGMLDDPLFPGRFGGKGGESVPPGSGAGVGAGAGAGAGTGAGAGAGAGVGSAGAGVGLEGGCGMSGSELGVVIG